MTKSPKQNFRVLRELEDQAKLTMVDIERILDISRPTINKLIKEGKFPEPNFNRYFSPYLVAEWWKGNYPSKRSVA